MLSSGKDHRCVHFNIFRSQTFMYKTHILFLFVFYSFVSHGGFLWGQSTLTTIDYKDKKTYEIGGILIEGAENRDRNAIKSIAKLREGATIQIPGPVIPSAIKALLKLRLFDDVQVFVERIEGEVVFLKMVLVERPKLTRWSYKGVKTSQHTDLNDFIEKILTKGGIITEDKKELARAKITEHFVEKGFLDTEVQVEEIPEEAKEASVRLQFVINKKKRIKIDDIVFEGNYTFSSARLKKQMKETKTKNALFKKSKLISKDYKEDLKNVVNFYRKEGYKNMVIVHDTLYRFFEGNILAKITINEGRRHYIRNIKWKGNSLYTDEYLSNILGITKGDVYNPELLETRLKFSMDGRDVSSLYLDDGYLGFEVNPVETAIVNDSVDIEMRIFEGPQFTINSIIIKGNDRTNEHVVRREIRTKPGQKFSRSSIIRSQREIINLGYFNPESMNIDPKVNHARGTVDIEYTLEEKPSDQLELSAGYGGFQGLIGTLGVVFNNFSMANVKDRSTWSPLPQGDGQKVSVRLQSNGRFFRSYNASFTEPWLGGKKPRSFSIGGVQTAFDNSVFGGGKMTITRGFLGLGSQLKWPDDFFSTNTTVNIETIELDNFGGFPIRKGRFNNFNIRQTFTRSSVSDPLYPRSGSRISLAIQFTPPYSLFRKPEDYVPTDQEIADIVREIEFENGPPFPVTEQQINQRVQELTDAKTFRWLEYHKWKFTGEWYFNLFDKFVVASNIKVGILGRYDTDLDIPPFERFELGGDGLNNQNFGLMGREIISFRGYDPQDIPANGTFTSAGQSSGAPAFTKYTMEFRYPLSLNPNSTIYATTWVQAGNAYASLRDFNPFDLRRSAGVGARVFLPMFGLLGFNYGWGFDKTPANGNYGTFNIVLGFEPE